MKAYKFYKIGLMLYSSLSLVYTSKSSDLYKMVVARNVGNWPNKDAGGESRRVVASRKYLLLLVLLVG